MHEGNQKSHFIKKIIWFLKYFYFRDYLLNVTGNASVQQESKGFYFLKENWLEEASPAVDDDDDDDDQEKKSSCPPVPKPLAFVQCPPNTTLPNSRFEHFFCIEALICFWRTAVQGNLPVKVKKKWQC
jgi:hypothetical protein